MANLNEYLGAIVAHLSQARFLADSESARIAMAYADNDLLKHFSIPRMRIDDVELTIPVAVAEFEIAAKREVKLLDNESVIALTHSEILASFGLRSLPADTSDSVRKDIAVQVGSFTTRLNQENSGSMVREYVSSIVQIVNKKIASLVEMGVIKEQEVQKWREATEKFKAILTQKLESEIARGALNHPALGNLSVVVQSDKLKEKSSHTLMTIKMKISEEAMEWERYKDENGNTISKLMPS